MLIRTALLIALLSTIPSFAGRKTPKYEAWDNQNSAQRYSEQVSRQIAMAGESPQRDTLDPKRARIGKLDAPIQIIVYSDFQCRFCHSGYRTIQGLHRKYGDKIVSMYKHFPLGTSKLSMPSARRFEAIALIDVDKAYKFHDILFEKQSEIEAKGETGLDEATKEAGVSLAEVNQKLKDPEIDKRIKSDMAEGNKYSISGTPSFRVNGILIRGAKSPAFFDELIRQIEKAPSPIEAKAAMPPAKKQ